MVNLGFINVAFNTQVLITVRRRTTLPIYIYSYLLLSQCGRDRLFRAFVLGIEDFRSMLEVFHLFDNNILVTVVIFCVEATCVLPMVIV